MKMYLISLAAGLLVGVFHSLINVRSPAPPLVARVGLLGILIGEQVIPVGKHLAAGATLGATWTRSLSAEHIFGMLRGCHAERTKIASTESFENRP
jgi:XapX domain-containing protein